MPPDSRCHHVRRLTVLPAGVFGDPFVVGEMGPPSVRRRAATITANLTAKNS